MIIWTGWGFLVAVIVFGFSLAANLLTNSITGGETYWDSHKWPFAISLFFSALACYLAGRAFSRRKGRILIDPETGQQVVLRKSHTLFFIPMIYWAPVLIVIGVTVLVMDLLA